MLAKDVLLSRSLWGCFWWFDIKVGLFIIITDYYFSSNACIIGIIHITFKKNAIFLVWNKKNRSQFFKEFHCTIITHSVLFTLVAKISLFCLRPVSTSYTYKLLAVVIVPIALSSVKCSCTRVYFLTALVFWKYSCFFNNTLSHFNVQWLIDFIYLFVFYISLFISMNRIKSYFILQRTKFDFF